MFLESNPEVIDPFCDFLIGTEPLTEILYAWIEINGNLLEQCPVSIVSLTDFATCACRCHGKSPFRVFLHIPVVFLLELNPIERLVENDYQ